MSTLDKEPVNDLYKVGILTVVIVPFLSLFVAIRQLWNKQVGWREISMLLGTYIPIALGVTVGLHRFFTHRSFRATKPLHIALGVLAELAVEGKICSWVANHTYHHKYSDKPEDLHSPIQPEDGFRGAWHAHTGWIFGDQNADVDVYAPHLADDKIVQTLDKYNWAFVIATFALPYLLWGKKGLIWGGLVRVFFIHHITWSVNSLCHLFGAKPYETGDNSRDLSILGWPTMGEAFHRTHHAFPKSARHGSGWWDDFSYLVIRILEWLGLVSNVWVPSNEMMKARKERDAKRKLNAA